MLAIWLDHWWAEVEYDIKTCMDTLSPDVSYRSYGWPTFGPPMKIDGHADARAMYQSMFDAGLMPGGPVDGEKVCFGSSGLLMEGLFTAIYPGHMLGGIDGLEPQQLYRMRWPMVVSHDFDLDAGLMKTEIMYPGPPISVEPSDAKEIRRLLGKE